MGKGPRKEFSGDSQAGGRHWPNPLKDLDLTKDRHLDFLPPGLEFLPLDLDFLPTGLDFLPPSLEFLPSGLEQLPCGLAGRPRLRSPLVPAGGGRLGVTFSTRVTRNPLKSPVSR